MMGAPDECEADRDAAMFGATARADGTLIRREMITAERRRRDRGPKDRRSCTRCSRAVARGRRRRRAPTVTLPPGAATEWRPHRPLVAAVGGQHGLGPASPVVLESEGSCCSPFSGSGVSRQCPRRFPDGVTHAAQSGMNCIRDQSERSGTATGRSCCREAARTDKLGKSRRRAPALSATERWCGSKREADVRSCDLGPSSRERIGSEGSSRSPLLFGVAIRPGNPSSTSVCADQGGAAADQPLPIPHSVEDDRPEQLANLRAECLVLCRHQRADRVTGQLRLRNGGVDGAVAAILASHHGSGLDR
jgi:hypothetical protein